VRCARDREVAREVLSHFGMKPHNPIQNGTKDPNQGEGDRISARHYNRAVREFKADGKVEDAAREAKVWVEREPEDAMRAEQQAKRGPHRGTRVSAAELVEKGRSVVDRIRPLVDRAANAIRSRLHRK
jgi:hypothetical protein